MVDKEQGLEADTKRRFGGAGGQSGHVAHGGHEANTWRTNGRKGLIGLEAGPKRIKGHKVGGHKADKFWRRSQAHSKADTWRTSSGDAAKAYRGQPFFF